MRAKLHTVLRTALLLNSHCLVICLRKWDTKQTAGNIAIQAQKMAGKYSGMSKIVPLFVSFRLVTYLMIREFYISANYSHGEDYPLYTGLEESAAEQFFVFVFGGFYEPLRDLHVHSWNLVRNSSYNVSILWPWFSICSVNVPPSEIRLHKPIGVFTHLVITVKWAVGWDLGWMGGSEDLIQSSNDYIILRLPRKPLLLCLCLCVCLPHSLSFFCTFCC